jgi:hypothetical protein
MQRVDMNNEIAPPHSSPWSSYHEHHLVTPTTDQGNTAHMFPSNPIGIETHQNFPHGYPPQTDGQHFVPTLDFSDQQRSIHQTSGNYAGYHNERQHGSIFQNRVWSRPDSQNISGRGGFQHAPQSQKNRHRNRSRGKGRQGDRGHPTSATNGGQLKRNLHRALTLS